MDDIQKYRHVRIHPCVFATCKWLPRRTPFASLTAYQQRQLDEEARSLARVHDLTYERVRAVLMQFAYPEGETAFDTTAIAGRDVPDGIWREVAFQNRCFHRAVEQLSAEEALSLF